jgi:hypothetical protein
LLCAISRNYKHKVYAKHTAAFASLAAQSSAPLFGLGIDGANRCARQFGETYLVYPSVYDPQRNRLLTLTLDGYSYTEE